jgi:hypothetical protein
MSHSLFVLFTANIFHCYFFRTKFTNPRSENVPGHLVPPQTPQEARTDQIPQSGPNSRQQAQAGWGTDDSGKCSASRRSSGRAARVEPHRPQHLLQGQHHKSVPTFEGKALSSGDTLTGSVNRCMAPIWKSCTRSSSTTHLRFSGTKPRTTSESTFSHDCTCSN